MKKNLIYLIKRQKEKKKNQKNQKKKKSKKKKKSDSEESEEEVKPKKSVKKEKKDSDDDSSEESEKKGKKEKKPEKKEIKIKDDDSDEEDEKPKKLEKKMIKTKKISSDEEDESDNDKKKASSDSDSDKESEKKKQKEEKKEQKKEKDSDEEDSNSEESEKKPKAKETAKKEEDSDEEEEKEKGKKDNDDEELPENAFEELFVRNIGFNTTQEELAEFFQKYGDVEESKICTDKNTGKSKGFGFLKFYEKKSAVAAMNDADNIVVGGRNLQIRYSNDKNSPIRGGGNNNNSGKKGPASEFGIFVGNMSYKCNEDDLKKFFKDCGKVLDVRIAKKPDGKLKGFAHVDFESKEAVDKAVQKNGEELKGRALKIDRSTGGKSGLGGGNKGGQGGRGRGREPVDPLAKARRSGGIIAPTENKVTTYDDSSDDE